MTPLLLPPPLPDCICSLYSAVIALGWVSTGLSAISSVGDMEVQEDTADILDDNLDENQRIISSNSAFTLVRPCPRSSSPCAEYTSDTSPPYSSPQGVSPPPYLPTSSPPGWYSSLLSSLYHSSTVLRCQEHNNNTIHGDNNQDTEEEQKEEVEKEEEKNSGELQTV